MTDAFVRLRRPLLLAGIAFLITVGALFHFYVYPRTTVVPLEQTRVQRLVSPSATYLDTATFRLHRDVPVQNTVAVYGDMQAGDDRTAVWVEFSSLDTRDGERVDYHERRTAFDRRTGLAVDCCGAYVDEDPGVRQTGLAFRLPARAEPRSYAMFDPLLRREEQLRFEREETVAGVPAYRYTYSAGPVKTADLPGPVPGTTVGMPEEERVAVARYTEITRTIWVEPESGLTVRTQERRRDTLRTPDQVERLVAFDADLTTSTAEVHAFAEEAARFRRWMLLTREWIPLGCALLAVLLAGGYAIGTRPVRSATAQHQQQVPGHDLANAG
ncbi:DUF3068 domain-containing protein [Microbispora hainanensis]|uniref:DUF3068 domain-containing protein n=1 Tax=Microbispora hainanensis TaxID=568844 RepID=UPI00142F2641|nr:DUF3068 domain-containing protein [Microbispora hainanensis]